MTDTGTTRIAPLMAGKPTFDEWFEAKHGQRFEQAHMGKGTRYDDTMRALCRAVRDYTTDMNKED